MYFFSMGTKWQCILAYYNLHTNMCDGLLSALCVFPTCLLLFVCILRAIVIKLIQFQIDIYVSGHLLPCLCTRRIS